MTFESGGHRVTLTREKAEQLLRPELEAGSISWNDFERTKQFVSVNRNYWPTLTGVISATALVYYGRWYRKRPWSRLTLLVNVPVAFAFGIIPGGMAQILAVKNFRKGLDDPKGLLDAIGRRIRLEHTLTGDDHRPEHPQRLLVPPHLGTNAESDSEGQEETPRDRWAEIRKTSATASTSTWDNIRQAHERTNASRNWKADVPNIGTQEDDRQAEQAKFDALLEAERKISESSQS